MFHRRLAILFGLFLATVLLVLARLWYVQVIDGERWREKAEAPAARHLDLPAVRGRILDRDGQLVATDRAVYSVEVTPSRFRRRSLIYALRDLCGLLDPIRGGTGDGGVPRPADRLSDVLGNPEGTVRRVLALPGSVLRIGTEVLEARWRPLTERRRMLIDLGVRARLREALGVLAGRRIGVAALADAGQAEGTLGEALDLAPFEILDLLQREIAALALVCSSDPEPSVPAIIADLEGLLGREQAWIDGRVERELGDLIVLSHFGSGCRDEDGTVRLTPGRVGLAAWNDICRRLDLRPADPERAAAIAARSTALLTGELPRFNRDTPEVYVGEPRDVIESDAGVVRAAFVARVLADPSTVREEYLPERREGALRRQWEGSRTWLVRRGADPEVADLVLGPGGLGRLGFVLQPAFARSESPGIVAPSTLLLRGAVNLRGRAWAGIERSLDDVVGGRDGRVQVHEDGREVVAEAPEHGRDVRTTLSLELQRRLEGVLPAAGAIAVVDARTGAVLALVTNPAPKPGGVEAAIGARARLEEERRLAVRAARRGEAGAEARVRAAQAELERSPAYHRALEHPGSCPPGSVFKAITILAGLETGVLGADERMDCGPATGTRFRCTHRHGSVGVEAALERSCNAFCYEVGARLGSDRLVEAYAFLGLFDAVPGLLGDESWRASVLRSDHPKNLAIGQGSIFAAPVRVAGLAASFALGRVVRPHLWQPDGFVALGPPIGRPESVARVREGLRLVVQGSGGTARRVGDLRRMRAAGKTGTAQVRTDLSQTSFQAWFAGFAPFEEPRYAVAVMLDRSDESGAEAAVVAARALEACADVLGRWW